MILVDSQVRLLSQRQRKSTDADTEIRSVRLDKINSILSYLIVSYRGLDFIHHIDGGFRSTVQVFYAVTLEQGACIL